MVYLIVVVGSLCNLIVVWIVCVFDFDGFVLVVDIVCSLMLVVLYLV